MTAAPLLLALLLSPPAPPAEVAAEAEQLLSEGAYGEAAELLSGLADRMPHDGRVSYNLAAALFGAGSFAAADSVLAGDPEGVPEDTMSVASTLASLAASMQGEDYAGVEAAAETLTGAVSGGEGSPRERTALEAALNWLEAHEPPESEDREDEQDRQEEDEQDRQEEDEQDRQEEPPDGEGDGEEESEVGPPPELGEMTPEQARAVLDLVEEAEAEEDSNEAGAAGYGGGPFW